MEEKFEISYKSVSFVAGDLISMLERKEYTSLRELFFEDTVGRYSLSVRRASREIPCSVLQAFAKGDCGRGICGNGCGSEDASYKFLHRFRAFRNS